MTIMQETTAAVQTNDALETRIKGLLEANNALVEEKRKLRRELTDSDNALRGCNSRLMRLEGAVRSIYTAGRWALPTNGMSEAEQARLWEGVRDAAGIAKTAEPAEAEGYVFGPWVDVTRGDAAIAGAFYEYGHSLGDIQKRSAPVFHGSLKVRRAYRIGEWHDWDGSREIPLAAGTLHDWRGESGQEYLADIALEHEYWGVVAAFRPLATPAAEEASVESASEWGAEIKVDGQPSWLDDEEQVQWAKEHRRFVYDLPAFELEWGPWVGGTHGVDAIKLRADHPYYVATSRGFEYWPGGETAPEDWDGSPVLLLDGREHLAECEAYRNGYMWRWLGNSGGNVIGYRKKAVITAAHFHLGLDVVA